jgi:hypothetical protein
MHIFIPNLSPKNEAIEFEKITFIDDTQHHRRVQPVRRVIL